MCIIWSVVLKWKLITTNSFIVFWHLKKTFRIRIQRYHKWYHLHLKYVCVVSLVVSRLPDNRNLKQKPCSKPLKVLIWYWLLIVRSVPSYFILIQLLVMKYRFVLHGGWSLNEVHIHIDHVKHRLFHKVSVSLSISGDCCTSKALITILPCINYLCQSLCNKIDCFIS